MGSRKLALALVFAPVCVALFAADKNFWDQKPYSEWSEKEVDRMLKNSPWAKTVALSLGQLQGRGRIGLEGEDGLGRAGGGIGPERGGGSEAGAGGAGGAGAEGGGMGGGGMRGGGGRGGGSMGGTMAGPAPSIVIAWYSGPVRQALARRQQLRNAEATQEQLDKILKYSDPSSIDFLVLGRALGASNPDALQKLKDETFLVKKNKEKIPLQTVQLPSGPGQPLILRFPRLIEGKAAVTLEDKEIELVTKMGTGTIRTRFKLAEMVVSGQLEL